MGHSVQSEVCHDGELSLLNQIPIMGLFLASFHRSFGPNEQFGKLAYSQVDLQTKSSPGMMISRELHFYRFP